MRNSKNNITTMTMKTCRPCSPVMMKNSEPYELVLGRVVMNSHSDNWFPRNARPRKIVRPTQILAARRLRRSSSKTAFCIVKLDETRTRVKIAARIVSRWVPAGGQAVCSGGDGEKGANRAL